MMKQLLEAGAHFGHRTRKWDPRMAPFIHSERNGVYIIDLRQTVQKLNEACRFVYDITLNGQDVMFVGTKKQARDSVRDEALRVSSPFVCERWLGGMLTNHQTIRQSIQKLANIEAMEEDGTIHLRPKKEILKLRKLAERLKRNLEGIQSMNQLPGFLVVVDIDKELIAVKEAHALGIPVIGLVDTNCNPNEVDICIPINDDSIKAVCLILHALSEAAYQGKQVYAEKVAEKVARIAAEEDAKRTVEEAVRKEQKEKEAIRKEREMAKEKAADIARQNREAEKVAKVQEKVAQQATAVKGSSEEQAEEQVAFTESAEPVKEKVSQETAPKDQVKGE